MSNNDNNNNWTKKKLQEKECNDSYLHDEIGGDPIESTNK